MSETPISPLRTRMIEDMSVRKFGEKTQNDYIRHVKSPSGHFTCWLRALQFDAASGGSLQE